MKPFADIPFVEGEMNGVTKRIFQSFIAAGREAEVDHVVIKVGGRSKRGRQVETMEFYPPTKAVPESVNVLVTRLSELLAATVPKELMSDGDPYSVVANVGSGVVDIVPLGRPNPHVLHWSGDNNRGL